MKYKFEYKYGRLYAFYKEHWWQRWKKLTPKTLHQSLYPDGNQQLTFKNYKEVVNDIYMYPDWCPKMVVYCRKIKTR